MRAFDEIDPGEGFLSAILGAIPSGVFVIDLDQNIILINQAAAELAGRSQGDCFDRKCYQVFDNLLCRTEGCLCRMATRNDQVQQGTTTIRRGSDVIHVAYASRPIKNIHGTIIGCVAHIQDITLRLERERIIAEQHQRVLRLLQEKSAQNIELERANRELVQLSRDLENLAQERTMLEMALRMADQFRNPVTAIGGLARLLARELDSDAPILPKLRALIREAEVLEERLKLLERLISEQRNLFACEDLVELAREVLSTAPGMLAARNTRVRTEWPDDPPRCTVNRSTFRVAMSKGLALAAAAAPENGEVTFRITQEHQGPEVVFLYHGAPYPLEPKSSSEAPPSSGPARDLLLLTQIMSEHQGTVWAGTVPDGRAALALKLPKLWGGRCLVPADGFPAGGVA